MSHIRHLVDSIAYSVFSLNFCYLIQMDNLPKRLGFWRRLLLLDDNLLLVLTVGQSMFLTSLGP